MVKYVRMVNDICMYLFMLDERESINVMFFLSASFLKNMYDKLYFPLTVGYYGLD